jgi:hypothetical protein
MPDSGSPVLPAVEVFETGNFHVYFVETGGSGSEIDQWESRVLADVFEVPVKGQHGAVVFLSKDGDIAVCRIYVFPFSLQLIGQPSGFEPRLIRLINNSEGFHELPDDR